MAGEIDIYNMALAHIGSTDKVADLNERSPERVQCSAFWPTSRDALFQYKDTPWNFATTQVALADLGDPPDGWLYRYRYPNDCLNALQVMQNGNPAFCFPEAFRAQFVIGYEAAGRVILTNLPEAQMKYVRRIEEPERYPSYFVEAAAFRLAAMIAMPLTKDSGLRNEMLQMAEQFAQIAMAATLNEAQQSWPERSIYEREIHA